MLQVIAWELSMVVALPTSLLVDMPERQQVDVALQVSDACVDVEMKNAVPRLASLEDWRSDEARATMQAIVIAMVNRRGSTVSIGAAASRWTIVATYNAASAAIRQHLPEAAERGLESG